MAETIRVGDYVSIDNRGEAKVLSIGERYVEVEISGIDYIADLSPRRLNKLEPATAVLQADDTQAKSKDTACTSTSSTTTTSATTASKQSRFLSVSDEDVQDLLRSEENANTAKKTLYDVKLLKQFLNQNETRESREICDIPPAELCRILCLFFIGVRKPTGENYEPTTLRGMLASFERYLKKNAYSHSLINDREFHELRETVKAKQKQLKRDGKGNLPQKADAATDDEIDRLWDSGQFGAQSPQAMINTLWFYFTLHFGLRGDTEHRNICWGDIQLRVDADSDGREYLEFSERQTKTRTGENPRDTRAVKPKLWDDLNNPSRCVVAIFKAYQSRRPAGFSGKDDPFYIATHTTKEIPGPDDQWFRRQPVGKNKLSSLMKVMAKNANLPSNRRLTNSSARKRLVQKLSDHNVPPTQIMQITGHKNIQSVNNYSSISESRHREISNILSSTVPSSSVMPSTSSSYSNVCAPEVGESRGITHSQSHVYRHTAHSEILSNAPIFGGPISGGVFNIHIHNKENTDFSQQKYRRIRVIQSSQSSDEE